MGSAGGRGHYYSANHRDYVEGAANLALRTGTVKQRQRSVFHSSSSCRWQLKSRLCAEQPALQSSHPYDITGTPGEMGDLVSPSALPPLPWAVLGSKGNYIHMYSHNCPPNSVLLTLRYGFRSTCHHPLCYTAICPLSRPCAINPQERKCFVLFPSKPPTASTQ